VHSHDYLAMERLHELHASGEYDLIVVDTPPSRNALDVLDAPGRMKEFFGSRLLRWLTVPYRSRLFTAASKPFYQVADRVLGSRFLQDIAEFFVLFQAMEKGFVSHADEVEQLLGDHRTTFVVVSTLEAAPAHEAAYLARELARRDFHLGAIVANRVLPESFTSSGAARSARRLADASSGELSAEVAGALDAPPDLVEGVLFEIAERFHDIALVATREAERRTELSRDAALLLSVPTLDRDVNDVSDLLALTDHLRGT
jgi:anion-transporting  ArsA/GET3 family ATPase